MAGPQHQPTAKPFSSSCYLPIQNKNQSRRRTFCVEAERKKMPDPEEDPPGPSTPKVRVQTGRFRPISDRSPQRPQVHHRFSKKHTYIGIVTVGLPDSAHRVGV